jgi:predicted MPP superfamily phosphohydrolase
MVRFIHAADFHLDSPLRSLPADKAAQRRAEQRELLDRLGSLAQDRGAELILLSGDLLDGEPGLLRNGTDPGPNSGTDQGPRFYSARKPRSLHAPLPLRRHDLAGERTYFSQPVRPGGGAAGTSLRGVWLPPSPGRP